MKKYKNFFIISIIFYLFTSICFSVNNSTVENNTYIILISNSSYFVWIPYYFTPEMKNFDFNQYIAVFSYSGDKAPSEYNISYDHPEKNDNCTFYGMKTTYDQDIRVWLNNGSFYYYYLYRVCINGKDNTNYVICTPKNCYIPHACFLEGYKRLCNVSDEEDEFVVFDKKFDLWRVNKTGGLETLSKNITFLSYGDGIELSCNNYQLCWTRAAPNVNKKLYYILDFRKIDHLKSYVPENISLPFEVDSVYFLDDKSYIYIVKNIFGYYHNGKNIFKERLDNYLKIKDCVYYKEKNKVYCLFEKDINGFKSYYFYVIDIENKSIKLIKPFEKFNLFEKIVSKGIDKDLIYFVSQTTGFKSYLRYLFTYNISNGNINYIKIDMIPFTADMSYFYNQVKKVYLINNSLVVFGLDLGKNGTFVKKETFNLNYPLKIKIIKVSPKTENLTFGKLYPFDFFIRFESISGAKQKILVSVYINGKKIISKNVSSDNLLEVLYYTNKTGTLNVSLCFSKIKKCVNYFYKVIIPNKREQVKNIASNISSENKQRQSVKKKENETKKQKIEKKEHYNNLIIIISFVLIIIIIIIFVYIKTKNNTKYFNKKDKIDWGD